MTDREEERVSELWKDYEDAKTYAAKLGLTKNLPMYVNFYEGRQWPAATKRTQNLPRPVINIVKMICRSKKSSILAAPVRMVYEAEDGRVDVKKFNDFADYITKELGQEALDKEAVQTGVIEGTYIYHYFWDKEAKGKRAGRKGGLRCELIDPLNIFFSDPTEKDEQKQKWIMIRSREEVSSLKAKADGDIDKEMIVSDEKEDPYGVTEQDGGKLCTVLTRYFRKNGEVFFEKAVKGTVINKACPLSPDVEGEFRRIRSTEKGEKKRPEDAPNNALPDNPNAGEDLVPEGTGANLYPVVVGAYEPRKGSIYGVGEVEGIIPNQKAINFNLAMLLLNNREMAWGKYVVLPDALQGQKITDEPGQVLIDYSRTGNGIQKMTEKGIQGQPLQLIDTLTQLTRKMTGATEVLSGEVLGANMSGSAIAQLQSQAKEPVKDLRDNFWHVKEKQGMVLAQFFKNFYFMEPYTTYKEEADRQAEEGIQIQGEFSSEEFASTEFSVVVEATTGTNASAAGDISALDALFAKGAISLKTYIKAYPKDALSNKSELLRGIEEEEQSEINRLRAENGEKDRQIGEMAQTVQKLQKVVVEQSAASEKVLTLIGENKRLKETLAALYTEASQKIAYANSQIVQGNRKIAETTGDAAEMAQVIAENAPGAIV